MGALKEINKGWLCVAGGAMVHLSLGTIYCWGNLNPYVISYIRQHDPNASYDVAPWVFACGVLGQSVAMFFGGNCEKRFGPRITVYIGGFIFVAGVLLSYFTLKNFILFCLTYGVMFGLGCGFAYSAPMVCGIRWMPRKPGLVSGCVVAGFGAGAFVFNFVHTAFVNPNNLSPQANGYFRPEDVENVPTLFLIIGAIYACMVLLGGALLFNPPQEYTLVEAEEEEGGKNNIESGLENQINDRDNVIDDDDEEEEKKKVAPMVTDVGPMTMIKTQQYWLMFFMFLFNGQTTVFISNLYKVFGQQFIHDDRFITLVGSFAAICNAGGRIVWGRIADRFSVRTALLVLTSCQAIFVSTFFLSENAGQIMYFVWVLIMFFNIGGNFSIFPAGTTAVFGRKFFGPNYGLVFLSQVPSAMIGAFLVQQLKEKLGFEKALFVMAGFSALSFLIAWAFTVKRKYLPCFRNAYDDI